MSGETQDHISGWTVDTLKVYLESLIVCEGEVISGNDRRYAERFDAQQQAIKDALAAADRAGIKAEQAASLQIAALAEKVEGLREDTSISGGRSQGVNAAIGYVVAGVAVLGLFVTIVVAVLTH